MWLREKTRCQSKNATFGLCPFKGAHFVLFHAKNQICQIEIKSHLSDWTLFAGQESVCQCCGWVFRECASDEWCSPGEWPGPYIVHFMTDMPNFLDCFIKLFADGIKVYNNVQSDEHRNCYKIVWISWFSGQRTGGPVLPMANVTFHTLERISLSISILVRLVYLDLLIQKHLVWRAYLIRKKKGKKDGKTTSGNGQAWSSPSPRRQWRKEKNAGNWSRSHLWSPNDLRG